MRVCREFTNGLERAAANQSRRAWTSRPGIGSLASSTWGMLTWASAILTNQWVGRGAERTSVGAVCVGEAEGAASPTCVEAPGITGSRSLIHRSDSTEITPPNHAKIPFLFRPLAGFIRFHCVLCVCVCVCVCVERGAESEASLRLISLLFQTFWNYNEKCRWHIFSDGPGITVGSERRRQKKKKKEKKKKKKKKHQVRRRRRMCVTELF